MKNTAITAIAVLVLIGGMGYLGNKIDNFTDKLNNMLSLGSVSVSNEYESRQIGTSAGTADPAILLRGAGGILGQVVITDPGVSRIVFFDATTSDATLRAGATSTLSSIDIAQSAAEGTYIFDARFTDGILMVTDGVVATATIMYR